MSPPMIARMGCKEEDILSLKEKATLEQGGEQVQRITKRRKFNVGMHERFVLPIITITGLVLLVHWCSLHLPLFDFSSFDAALSTSPTPELESLEKFYRDYSNSDITTLRHLDEHPRSPAYLVKAFRGAVASEDEICSKMGADVLKRGGNAVDAAISTTFCIGVVNMYSSGIGGGGFMVVRIPPSSGHSESEVWSLNFRETAPAQANGTMFEDDPLKSRWGGLAVGIPGEIRGLQEAHTRWGRLPWKELVEPSARLAAGWKMGRELARRIRLFEPMMLGHPDWKPLFAPEGVLLKEGDWVNWTSYSSTLSMIAEQGPDVFYQGPIADAIVSKVRQTGGVLSHEDLKNYRLRIEKPLVGTYNGRKIYTTPAPGGGTLLLQILNVLENYDMSSRTPINVHRFVEAMKFAFASRTKMCDPRNSADIAHISRMSSKEFAHEIFLNITDDRTHSPEYYQPEFGIPMDRGTSHTSVVDQDGMAVSITSTINSHFGSLVLDPVTGIILNNQMDDFSVPGVPNDFGLVPSPYNYPEPGKIPLSSTSPAIIENPDGSFYAGIGGSGGGRIFPSVAQVLLNLDWGLHASDAVESGRLHDQLYPPNLVADDIYPSGILDFLRQAGHNISTVDVTRVEASSMVQIVMEKEGIYHAASDSRKSAIAVGW